MRQQQILRVQRVGNHWRITDPRDKTGGHVKVDSAVIAATEVGEDWAKGYLLSVHGLSQRDAEHFDMNTLHALGFAAHMKGYSPPPHLNRSRYQLTQDGRIERDAR